jgi:glutamate--cysteine ligase
MEAYFDRHGPAGRLMMCGTAALQVNLDVGADTADVARRWRLLHAVGPTLVAAFANSPRLAGRDTGWKSTRQAVWLRLDPPRTRPPEGPDPVRAWADYALDAPLMARWLSDGRRHTGLTFRQWVEGADANRAPPTADDLDYHLTTLFPPVRPRGWFEVRYIDAQPAAYWPVPLAVLTALIDDPAVGDHIEDAVEPVRDAWEEAARYGLASPALARAAHVCFAAALDRLTASNADPALLSLVESYTDRYVAQGRSPADDAISSSARAERATRGGNPPPWSSGARAASRSSGNGQAAHHDAGINGEGPDEPDRTAHVRRHSD